MPNTWYQFYLEYLGELTHSRYSESSYELTYPKIKTTPTTSADITKVTEWTGGTGAGLDFDINVYNSNKFTYTKIQISTSPSFPDDKTTTYINDPRHQPKSDGHIHFYEDNLLRGQTYYLRAELSNSTNRSPTNVVDGKTYGGMVKSATYPYTVPPGVSLQAWQDTNRNGVWDEGEVTMPGRMRYTLEKWDSATNKWGIYATANRPSGAICSQSLNDGTFRVKAESLDLVDDQRVYPTNPGANQTVGYNGYSSEFTISSANPMKSITAGFVPQLLPAAEDFTKTVWDGTQWATGTTITSTSQILTYRLALQLPSDTIGYSSIEIKDILPAEMELADPSPVKNVTVKAGDDTLTTADGNVSYNAATHTISYKFNSGFDLISLGGKILSVEITTKLKNNLPSYPSSVANQGQLIINAAATPMEVGSPGTSLENSVSGTVWQEGTSDENIANQLDAKDTLLQNVPVQLYKKTAEDTWALESQTTTDENGRYSFAGLAMEGVFHVAFPTGYNSMGLVDKTSTANGSAAAINGTTEPMDMVTGLGYTANCGYKAPPVMASFTKTVWDKTAAGGSGAWGSNPITITSLDDSIKYQIAVELPSSFSGISSLQIQDVLPAGLQLFSGDETTDVTVFLGSDTTNLAATHGTLTYTDTTRTVSFTITNSHLAQYATELAGKTLLVQLDTKLCPTGGQYPSSITNTAKLLLNGAENPATGQDPTQAPNASVQGTISGYAFHDADYNGLYQTEHDTVIPGLEVKLYKIGSDVPVATATTNENGEYLFSAEIGHDYQIQFAATTADDKVLIRKGTGSNASHANSTGLTDTIALGTQAGQMHKTANAGYSIPFTLNGFTKTVWDTASQQWSSNDITISDAEQEIRYQVSAEMPASMAGLLSLEIQDILPAGLQLYTSNVKTSVNVYLEDEQHNITNTHGNLTYNADTRTVSFTVNTDKLALLANKTLFMQLGTKLSPNAQGEYTTCIANTAQVIANGNDTAPIEPPTSPPTITLRGTISGTAFEDLNKNNLLNEGEGLPGIPVVLLKENGGTLQPTGTTTTTNANGKYTFVVETGSRYAVQFPTLNGTNGLVTKGSSGAAISHANHDGRTDIIMVSNTSNLLHHVKNAGYVLPAALGSFSKTVWDAAANNGAGGWSNNPITITDVTLPIRYQVTVAIPASTSGITSFEIQDELPDGLQLYSSTLEDEVTVTINGINAEADDGSLSQSGKIISYILNPEKMADFAGKTVLLELRTKLETVGGGYPSSINNTARVLVNKEAGTPANPVQPITPTTPPAVNVMGSISGTAFEDKNNNDTFEKNTDFPLKNVVVTLLKDNGGTLEPTGKTATTDEDGRYHFSVETEKNYVVKFPTLHGSKGLVAKGQDTTATGSHADAGGYTATIAVGNTSTTMGHTRNVGYKAPGGLGTFTKTVWDGTQWSNNPITVTSMEQKIKYQVMVEMPASMSGVTSLEILDILPENLQLYTEELQDNVSVTMNNSNVPDTHGTLTKDGQKIIFTLAPEKLGEFAGNTVYMELETKLLANNEGQLPHSVNNQAQVLINKEAGTPETPVDPITPPTPPVVDVKGVITGIAFEDKDKDNVFSSGDVLLDNIEVTLLRDNNGTLEDTGISVTTGADGKYTFAVTTNRRYAIKFPTLHGTDGLISKSSGSTASHVNYNGQTDAFVVENKSNSITHTRNVGYRTPDEPTTFTKSVWDSTANSGAGGWSSNPVTITNATDKISYQVLVTLPSSTSGITSLEIRDELPTGLQLYSGSENDVSVTINGQPATLEDGTLSLDGKAVVFTLCADKIASLAGGNVAIQLDTRLETISGSYPPSVNNTAQVLVNKGGGTPANPVDPITPPVTPPNVDVKGEISGIMWNDANENGTIDSGEPVYSGKTVTLYVKNGGSYQPAGVTATTGNDGSYRFVLDEGKEYQVHFPQIDGLRYTGTGSGANASHANPANGQSHAISVTRGTRQTANAGYRNVLLPTGFSKLAKNPANGNYGTQVTITDLTQPLEYRIEATMPASMEGYRDLKLIDKLPASLELWNTTTLSSSATIKVDGTNITTDASWGTLSYDAGTHTLSYVFMADKLPQLANTTVEMELKTRIIDTTATAISNKAELISSAFTNPGTKPVTPETGIQVKGVVEGRIWNDSNGNGMQDDPAGTNLEGHTVILQQPDGSGWKTAATATTSATGQYRFEAAYGSYRVQFPKRPPMGFTPPHAGAQTNADSQGCTQAVALSNSTPRFQLDAGYVMPTFPVSSDITKTLVGESGETNHLTIANPATPIEYRIRVQLGSLTGYQELAIVDEMDSRLNYQSASVWLNNTELPAAGGQLTHNPATNTLRYQFAQPLNAALENQVVELRLVVTIRPGLASYANIQNQAKVIVNGSSSTTSDDSPSLSLEYGHASGYLFEDTNKNGQRDETVPAHIAGTFITLESWDGTQWTTVQKTIAQSDGRYRFTEIDGSDKALPYGKYRIHAEVDKNEFTYAQQNQGCAAYCGRCSDANADTGYVEFTISAQLRQPIAGIGLVPTGEPIKEKPQTEFKKNPSNETVKPGDKVAFVISGFGNNTGSHLQRYGISDMVPKGLELESGTIPALEKGGKVTYSIEYTTNFNSSFQILHANVSAAQAFHFSGPALASGERVTALTIKINSAPPGFAVGNTITLNFIVSDDIDSDITNWALLSQGSNSTPVPANTVKVKNTTTNSEDDTPDDTSLATTAGKTKQNETAAEDNDVNKSSLGNDNLPLANDRSLRGDSWSLFNALLVTAGLCQLVFIALLAWRKKQRANQNSNGNETAQPANTPFRALLLIGSILSWTLAAVLMLLTQNWFGNMVFADKWTILLALLCLVSAVTGALANLPHKHKVS